MNKWYLVWILSIIFFIQGCGKEPTPLVGDLNILLVEFSSGAIVSDRVIQLLNEQEEVIQEGWVDGEGKGKFINLTENQVYKIKIINLSALNIMQGHDTEFFSYDVSLVSKVITTYNGNQSSSLAVPVVLQNPSLPNGCEITALTSVFNYYGYSYTKENLADNYLEKQEFSNFEGKRVNVHPSEKFIGNPRDGNSGMYAFVEPIKKAAEEIIVKNKLRLNVKDYSNLSLQELEMTIGAGIPIVTWVTLDLSEPQKRGGWYIEESNQFYESYVNLHVVTLIGQSLNHFTVMDPLQGIKEYPKELFYQSYVEMGSQGMSIVY